MPWCGCPNWDHKRPIQCFDAASLIQVWLSLLPFLYWQWRVTLFSWTELRHIKIFAGIWDKFKKRVKYTQAIILLCKFVWGQDEGFNGGQGVFSACNNSWVNRNICWVQLPFFNGRKSLLGESETMSHCLLGQMWLNLGVELCQRSWHCGLCSGTQDAGWLPWQSLPLKLFQTRYRELHCK